jgi:predicted phosphoribosyltransferase
MSSIDEAIRAIRQNKPPKVVVLTPIIVAALLEVR